MITFGVILGFFSITGLISLFIIFGIIFAYLYLLLTLKRLFGTSAKVGNGAPAINNYGSNIDSIGFKIINEFKITAIYIVSGLLISAIIIAIYSVLIIVYDWRELPQENCHFVREE